jgi:hypothetical protein
MQASFVGSVRPFQATSRPVATAIRPQRAGLIVENRVALRFQRFGRKKLPFYRLVAIDSRDRRDGRPLEYLGCVALLPACSPLVPCTGSDCAIHMIRGVGGTTR